MSVFKEEKEFKRVIFNVDQSLAERLEKAKEDAKQLGKKLDVDSAVDKALEKFLKKAEKKLGDLKGEAGGKARRTSQKTPDTDSTFHDFGGETTDEAQNGVGDGASNAAVSDESTAQSESAGSWEPDNDTDSQAQKKTV